ncbi:hydroxymethylglutaryl-CoA synthase family protein [Magnetovibrio blakemorei]|uniref:3-hydroxy-3-methylglutaryl-ACP synthase n=1 Tax=Magnetovibrio blakemorei TaxID=28181 RepID=A0A1E5QAK0_9PROT|nr:hydroxymethylglutaryl-CoA synthase [Magnetovibrio blakemorei]OEJ69013.1 3-hydroxy-3-methylglutaryl-ACP synthase [Magnetovibrio blakemorei]
MQKRVGIEAMNLYGGIASLDVLALCRHRGLDMPRFENLLMEEKTVALPYEDPVSFAVNAARPLIDQLSLEELARVEMVITCTESGIDFGKSLSTYLHPLLNLPSNCRLFEVKQACYSGTVGVQMAVNFLLGQTSPGAKVLVVTTDISRFALADPNAIQEWAYSEPSSGAGAVAMLLSDTPHIFAIDTGAYGNHAFEVMDTCRPGPDTEAGDADLSLMAYLDCCDGAFKDYARRVEGADFRKTFDYLSFHTPFGGMVRGAHRHLMRKLFKADPDEIDADFEHRLRPSLAYGKRMGNSAGGSLYVALAGTINTTPPLTDPVRIGLFSYGSGCCSEFFSGTVTPDGQKRLQNMNISGALERRYPLSIEQYEALLLGDQVVRFGTKDAKLDCDIIPEVWPQSADGKWLFLDAVEGYHRKYKWA